MKKRSISCRIVFSMGILLKLAFVLVPLACFASDISAPRDAEAIEAGLSAIKTINVDKWMGLDADSIGRWVCCKINASTNVSERIRFQKAYYDATLTMAFDRKTWHEADISFGRFIDLSCEGFRSFNGSDDECIQACQFVIAALVRARCEIQRLEQQVAREIAADEAHTQTVLSWQRRCAKLGIPHKSGLLTHSGSRPTARGAKLRYEQMVATYIDGEFLKTICSKLPEERRQILLKDLQSAIGRHPKWHEEETSDAAKSVLLEPVGRR